MSGQILGDRYEVERQIGKQTGRWTLLARDLATQKQVVIKLLFLDEQVEWDDLKLFEREVEILKSLSHPYIPRYLGYFEHELPNTKALALIQSYVEGMSLEQCLQQKRKLTETEAKQIAKALLQILVYLHKQIPPIVHRDIKPSNLVLAQRHVHLVDFGSVKAITNHTDTAAFTVVGTYGYMPPEQFSGRIVPASDLYSLGATLIALITATHPSSLPRKGTRIDLEQVATLTPEFTDWLHWLTEPNLERRAKSAEEVLQALTQGRSQVETITPVPRPLETKIALTKDSDRLEILIPSLLGQLQLQIDSQQISMTNKRLGLPAGRPLTTSRAEISKLEYHKGMTGVTTQSNLEPQLTIWAGNQKYELGGNASLTEAELDWLAYELSSWLKLPVSEA